MDKVNDIPASPLDMLLLPVWLHKRITVGLNGLFFAFLFVGSFDMFFYRELYASSFFQGNFLQIAFKLIGFAFTAFLVGMLDVVSTMYPVADFARFIGKRSEKYVSPRFPVVLMKSYAWSHVIALLPYGLWSFLGIEWASVNAFSPMAYRLTLAILITVLELLPFGQLGIIYRTISVKTRIQVFGKLILILAAYFWMQLSSNALQFFQEIAYFFLVRM